MKSSQRDFEIARGVDQACIQVSLLVCSSVDVVESDGNFLSNRATGHSHMRLKS